MTNLAATAKIVINGPAADVFEAFADPDKMTRFWFPRATGRLVTGKQVRWFVGRHDTAPAITVRVKRADKPHKIQLEWGDGDHFNEVRWQFRSLSEDQTEVCITETGFSGDNAQAIRQALDSTAGFNQVITAAKTFVEHGVAVNVVDAHVTPG